MHPINDSSEAAPDAPGQDPTSLLHARGQRATPQRLVILRELRRRGRHTTADELRRSIRDELPGTSIPTVYATLDLLVELDLARRVDAGGGPALYDPRVDPHQHMVCRRCGRVEDLDHPVRPSRSSGRPASTASPARASRWSCPGCAPAARRPEAERHRRRSTPALVTRGAPGRGGGAC